jgi:hypothetical protein
MMEDRGWRIGDGQQRGWRKGDRVMALIRSFRDLNAYQRTRMEIRRIFEMINNMIVKADDFCPPPRR